MVKIKGREESLTFHQAIFDAIRTQRADYAESLMQCHLANAKLRLTEREETPAQRRNSGISPGIPGNLFTLRPARYNAGAGVTVGMDPFNLSKTEPERIR